MSQQDGSNRFAATFNVVKRGVGSCAPVLFVDKVPAPHDQQRIGMSCTSLEKKRGVGEASKQGQGSKAIQAFAVNVT